MKPRVFILSFIMVGLMSFVELNELTAKPNSPYASPDINKGWKLYFNKKFRKSEEVAKILINNGKDKDGTATVLLARVRYDNGLYKETLYLLRKHSALRVLYNEKINSDGKYLDKNWPISKKILYFRLKGLWGRSKYQLGERNNSVLQDLIESVAYDDADALFSTPDVEAMQFIAFLVFSKGEYEQAVHYWQRTIKGLKKIISQDPSLASEANDGFINATEYNIACAYAKMKNVEKTIKWLEKSLSYKPESRIKHIMKDNDLDDIREHAEFKKFIGSIKNRGRQHPVH